MPAALTILAHLSVSATTKALSLSGVLDYRLDPAPSRVSVAFGSASAALNAVSSLSTIGFGVPAGTNAANHACQVVAKHAGFRHGRQVGGQARRTLGARTPPAPSPCRPWRCGSVRRRYQRRRARLAAEEIGDRLRIALVGDVDHVDAGEALQHLASQARRTGGRCREARRAWPGVVDQLLRARGRHGRVDHERQCDGAELGHRLEVADRIVGQLQTGSGWRRGVAFEVTSTVCPSGSARATFCAARKPLAPAHVVDHDPLAEARRHLLAEHAGEGIGWRCRRRTAPRTRRPGSDSCPGPRHARLQPQRETVASRAACTKTSFQRRVLSDRAEASSVATYTAPSSRRAVAELSAIMSFFSA